MTTTLSSPPRGPAPRPLAANGPQSNARAFTALLWRRRWVAALTIVVVGASVAIGLAVAERQYTATTRIAATPPAEATTSPASYEDLLGTVAAVAESRPLLEDVSAAIGTRSVRQLGDRVSADVVGGTVLIQVAVTDPDPTVAAQVANAVATTLVDHDPTNGFFVLATAEPAVVPTEFSAPNVKVTLLAGGLLAVAAAVAVAALVDRFAHTVDTAEEIAGLADSAVLGAVSRPRDLDGVPALDTASEEFPSLRALRVALEFASREQPTRCLVVAPAAGTADRPGWLEVNLAVALAGVGHRVLVVDGDRSVSRRHPALEGDGPGLYDVLAGTASVDDVVRPGPTAGVDVLPIGHVDLAAPSLLEMRFRGLLAETERLPYDVVLVHAAPLTGSEDARVMAIDGAVLLTVPAGRVRPRTFAAAVAHLRGSRIRVLGSVLVGVRA